MTTALEEGEGSASRPGRSLPPVLGTHYTGGWVGPRAGLDRCGKSRLLPPPAFNPRTVQTVASRYVDYATRPTYKLNPRKENS